MTKALKRPHHSAFHRKWWQLLILMLAFVSAEAQDSARYAPINGYGFRYKRFGIDSVFMLPYYESPHTPYRAGALKYRRSDSSLYKYTGTQWLKVQEGGSSTTGIDTVYTMNDTVQVIETPSETYFTIVNSPFTSVVNDSTIVVGNDTLVIRGRVSTATGSVTSITQGYGIIATPNPITSTGTIRADTTRQTGLPTYYYIDSPRTVTKLPLWVDAGTVDTLKLRYGFGLTTAAADTALRVDSLSMLTRAMGQKKIDSLAALMTSATITDTAIIKALGYRPGTTALVSTNKFIRLTACVFRPDITAGNGNPITWPIISSGGHDYIYVDSVVSESSSGGFRVYYPKVREVIMAGIIPDETLAAYAIKPGASINTQYALFNVYKQVTYSGTLTGGGSSWSADGNLSGISLDYNTGTGLTRLNLPGTMMIPSGTDYTRIGVWFNGDSVAFVERVTSGLVTYNFGFKLKDIFNSYYTGSLSAGMRVVINTAIPFATVFESATVSTENSSVYTTLSNWWYWGIMEVWMNATNVNSTSNYIEWQVDATASAYKIYRSTNADFSGETLVYSGTGTSFQDFGLTTNTLYHYRMVSVVSGVDTERTRGEKCRTMNMNIIMIIFMILAACNKRNYVQSKPRRCHEIKKLLLILFLIPAILNAQTHYHWKGNQGWDVLGNQQYWKSRGNNLGYFDSSGLRLYKPLYLGTWTTAGRPSPARAGDFGYNTDSARVEWHTGSGWIQSGNATGGGFYLAGSGLTLTASTFHLGGTVTQAAYLPQGGKLVQFALGQFQADTITTRGTFLIRGTGANNYWRIHDTADATYYVELVKNGIDAAFSTNRNFTFTTRAGTFAYTFSSCNVAISGNGALNITNTVAIGSGGIVDVNTTQNQNLMRIKKNSVDALMVNSNANVLVGTATEISGLKFQVVGKSYFSDTARLDARFSYNTNLGNTFVARSLVDKGYVDSALAVVGATTIYNGNGTLSGNRVLSGGGNSLELGASGSSLSAFTARSSGAINLYGTLHLNQANTSTDANYIVLDGSAVITLIEITSNRTVALPTATAGKIFIIWNQNSSGNTWSFGGGGATVTDAAGSSITTLTNDAVYILLGTGSAFLKIN